MDQLLAIAVLFVLAACGAGSPPPPLPAPAPAPPDPRVDMACVARARDGKLLDDLPAELDGFRVTAIAGGAHLHRDGRALTSADSERLWKAMSHDVFDGGGLATGSSGQYASFTCDDAPKTNCFELRVWICQVDLATLAARLRDAAEHAGAADALISVDVKFEETRGPTCRDGAACTPVAHYSRKGVYDPRRPRHPLPDRGRGACSDDGDCEGAHSNYCLAWYLRGGFEDAIELEGPTPTFCGCVDSHCRWFTQ